MNKTRRNSIISALRNGETGTEIDCEIARAFKFTLLPPREDLDWMIQPEDGEPFPLPPYSSSYDAAALLLEEGWGFSIELDIKDPKMEYKAVVLRRVYHTMNSFKVDPYGARSKSGPGALCIAAIRARYRD